jgi:hypothetical protein
MDFHSAIEQLHKSKTHKEFVKKNAKNCFLAHAFVMLDNGKEEWQIGYFCPKEDLMSSFIIDKEITELPPAEVLKSHIAIKALDPKEVKIDSQEAMDIADKTRKQHYPSDVPIKTFYIIQHLSEGAVYNITFVTQRFSTINIKILAKDGTVFKHSNETLMQFDKGESSDKGK